MYTYNIHMHDNRLQANSIGRLMVKLINLKEIQATETSTLA